MFKFSSSEITHKVLDRTPGIQKIIISLTLSFFALATLTGCFGEYKFAQKPPTPKDYKCGPSSGTKYMGYDNCNRHILELPDLSGRSEKYKKY